MGVRGRPGSHCFESLESALLGPPKTRGRQGLHGAGAQMLSFSLGHTWKPPTSWCTPRRPRGLSVLEAQGRDKMMRATGHLGQSQVPTSEHEISAKPSGQEKKKQKSHRVRVDQIPKLKEPWRDSAGEYQADEPAVVARLSWRVSGR